MSNTLSLSKLEERLSSGFYSSKELEGLLINYQKSYDRSWTAPEVKEVLNKKLDLVKSFMEVQATEVSEAEPTIDETPPEVVLTRKFLQLYQSAKKREKEFDLTLSDVKKLLKRKTCYYTGVRLTGLGDNQRTIDRINAKEGYVKGNVVACSHWANQMKNDLFENSAGGKCGIPLYGKSALLVKLISKVGEIK